MILSPRRRMPADVKTLSPLGKCPRRTRPGRREPRVRRADLRGRPAARQLALEPRPFRAVGSRGRGRRTVAAAPSAPSAEAVFPDRVRRAVPCYRIAPTTVPLSCRDV